MTNIFYSQIPDISEYEESLVNLLNVKEQQRIRKITNDKKRKVSLMSRIILLSESGIPFDTEFTYDEKGKPSINELEISITHTDNICAIALSDQPVGIDIESKQDECGKIAEKYFDEAEKEYLRQCPNGFRRVWTLKEAVSKLFGIGLSIDISSYSVYPFDTEHLIKGKYVTFYCNKIFDIPLSCASFNNDAQYSLTEINSLDLIKEIIRN